MSQIPADDTTRREVLRDLATGLLSLVLSAGLALAHFGQEGRLHEDFGREPGPALLPELLLTALALAGAGMLGRGVFGLCHQGGRLGFGRLISGLRSLGTALSVTALLVLFLVAEAAIGFSIAALGLGAAVAMILSRQEGGSIPRAAFEGVVIAIILYALFRFVLSVPLT